MIGSDTIVVDAARRAPLLVERTNLRIQLALLGIHMLPAMGLLRALVRETTHLLEAAKLIIDDLDLLHLIR